MMAPPRSPRPRRPRAATARPTPIDRRPGAARRAGRAPGSPPRRRRGGPRRGPILLLLALLLVAGARRRRLVVRLGALHLHSRRARHGRRSRGRESSRRAGLDVELGDPAYSETVPAGRVVATDPAAGARVLDGGTVTLVGLARQGAVRRPDAEGQDRGPGTGRAARQPTSPSASRSASWSETVAEGTVIAQRPDRRHDPAARHRRRPASARAASR